MSKQLIQIGVQSKPPGCRSLCPYASVSSGFVNDYRGSHPKVAFMIPHPTADDCINRHPMSGKAGESFLDKYIRPLGYDKNDCIFSAVMRCRPKGNGGKGAKWGTPVTGVHKASIEQACRQYDKDVLAHWGPDCYVISFELSTIYTEPAFTRLLQADIAKAFKLAGLGYKPLVLMGNNAASLFAPYIVGNGGCKAWRGTWAEMQTYPFVNTTSLSQQQTFKPASWK